MLILTQKCRANPPDLDQTHVTHLCTRACVENILLLMSTYKSIKHILIAIHLYTLWKKKTHFHAQSVASNFTPNLYPKHLLSQTTYIHLKYTIQIFIVSLIFIYMHIGKLITSCTYLHSKRHSTLSYIHLGRQSFTLC